MKYLFTLILVLTALSAQAIPTQLTAYADLSNGDKHFEGYYTKSFEASKDASIIEKQIEKQIRFGWFVYGNYNTDSDTSGEAYGGFTTSILKYIELGVGAGFEDGSGRVRFGGYVSANYEQFSLFYRGEDAGSTNDYHRARLSYAYSPWVAFSALHDSVDGFGLGAAYYPAKKIKLGADVYSGDVLAYIGIAAK